MASRKELCGACGCLIQRLEPSSSWRSLALQQAAAAGTGSLSELMLAQAVHAAIVHDEVEVLPPLVSAEEWMARK